MKNTRSLHPKEAAEALGICIQTLIRSRSGGEMNERRRGMTQLLALVGEQAVDVVL
ncbi:MAG TPA: hypothetical protein VKB35_10540 [Ktedonobacteraceae bacterium]|nr:hypothetical protein [Ktedonobacteraceae bacterium]